MKILYVITKANWGGAQRYVYDLATAKRPGDDVLVAYGTPGRLSERLTAEGIRTAALPGLARDVSVRGEWTALRALFALMRRERPDVVHVNSSKAGLALLAARAAGVPRIVFTAHGWAFNEARAWWQKPLLTAAYAATILLSHATICVSDAVKRDMSLPFLGKKLVVIRNGIDGVAKALPQEEARQALSPGPGEGLWLGMIAELHPTKRIEDAIDALAELPDARLVVMGEGGARAELERRATERGVSGRVRFAGFIPDAERYLSAFDVFLMPSASEALGYALLEAGSVELPVVASVVGGIPEIVVHKHSGLLVPPRNPHALARAIREYAENPALAARYGAALKARVGERFSRANMLEATFRLYER